MEHAVTAEGDTGLLSRLDALLDDFPAWFGIATHEYKHQESELLS